MSRASQESPSTDTSFIWRCSTAAAQAPSRTREVRALPAREPAARGMAPVAKAPVARAAASPVPQAAKRAAVPISCRRMRPLDMVRSGARLILSYDAASNAFKGTVENTTNGVLTNVRIEVHLSNGTELGPTTPIDLAPGQIAQVNLPSTQALFTGWIAHAEVGGGEVGGEHGTGNGEGGGEHGGSGEGGGEHGSGGERRGGG